MPVSSASFTPAASSHTANDVVGAEAEFVNIGLDNAGHDLMITSASLTIAGGPAEASAFRLHLYNVTPPSSLNDDDAFDIASGDRASYLGYIELGTPVDAGATCWVESHIVNKQVRALGTSLWGYLVNLTTVSTAAVAHTVVLHSVKL